MISKMEIWLKCGKDSIQLPILPASYNVTRDAGHETWFCVLRCPVFHQRQLIFDISSSIFLPV